jgi:hypothetical protein
MQDSAAHGWGVLKVAATGDSYNGAFANGAMTGWGLMRYGNGDQYEGSFENGKAHGLGYYTWACGDRYSGSFRNGEAHGRGIKVWAQGRQYEGQWQRGREHGHGVMRWEDGSSCTGQWVRGVMHGSGQLVNSRGDRFASVLVYARMLLRFVFYKNCVHVPLSVSAHCGIYSRARTQVRWRLEAP